MQSCFQGIGYSTGFHLQQEVSSTASLTAPPTPAQNGFLKNTHQKQRAKKELGGKEYYVQLPSCCYDQTPEGHKEKKDFLFLAHNFRGIGPQPLDLHLRALNEAGRLGAAVECGVQWRRLTQGVAQWPER